MPLLREILEADAHRAQNASVLGILVGATETCKVVLNAALIELIELTRLVRPRNRHDLFGDLSRENVS